MTTRKEERINYENRTKPNEWDQVWNAIVANSGNPIAANSLGRRRQSVENAQKGHRGQFANPDKGHSGLYPPAEQNEMHESARHNGICNPCRGVGGNRDTCNNDFPSETRRAMERDSRWHKRALTNTYKPNHPDRYLNGKHESMSNAYGFSAKNHKGSDIGKGLFPSFRMAGGLRLQIQGLTKRISRARTRGKDADEYFRAALMGFRDDMKAQSTVEYAIVMAAGLSIIVALGLLTNAVDEGMFIQHAVIGASHNVSGCLGGVVDVFNF